MPGRESAILADPGGSGHTWINPSRIADSGVGFDAGYATAGNVSSLRSVLHVKGSYAFGYELAAYSRPDIYYTRSGETEKIQALSFAKRGFGSGSWSKGLRLGASLRYAYQVYGSTTDYYDSYEITDEYVWAMDAGMMLDVPLPEYQGRLTLGAYALQATTGLLGPRQFGLQAKWLDPSGWLRVDGAVDAYNPRYRREWKFHVEREPDVPNMRLAAAGLFTHAEIGAAMLPAYDMFGPTLKVKFHSWSFLRDLGFGAEFLLNPSDGGGSVLTGHLEAKIRFRSDTALARDYDQYRRRRPGPIAPPAPAVSPEDSASPALVEDQWNRNWILYREDKIGVWHGIVWPYVNTFGVYTTIYIPAGTSSLSVGNYTPGFVLLGGWAAAVAVASLYPGLESEERAATYAIGQVGLKLVDWALARRFVKAHNRELRKKYRLGAAPVIRGSAQGALVSLAF